MKIPDAKRSAALLAILLSVSAAAQDYPNKPIRIVVPTAPGGGMDLFARLIGQQLGESLHESVIIDNRAGGGGNIAAEMAARANADGYTLLIGSATLLAVNPRLAKVNYDARRDFAPIAMLGSQPHLLVVHPSLPARSLQEFVALAKSKPNSINYGSSGNGGPAHLGTELFKIVAGIQLTHIPYKGTGPAVVDLVGGQIQAGFISLAPSLPHVKTGRLRALAATSPRRIDLVPDLPTVAESGYPGFEVRSWYGLLAPANTPRTIIAKLNRQLEQVLRAPEVIARLAVDGVQPGGGTPAQFASYIDAEIARWGSVVKTAKIHAD